jgi:hypothetical protein
VKATVQSFELLCDCLVRDETEAARIELKELLSDNPYLWPQIIDHANRHFLAPALWSALEQKGFEDILPEDVRDFLKECRRLNRSRNQKIKEQAEELVVVLNEAGVTPVILKGGVYLFEDKDTAFDTRMMVDIDLLVAPEHWEVSIERAHNLGYKVVDEHQPWAHDYHALRRTGDAAALEFHKDVGKQRQMLSVKTALQAACPLDVKGCRLLALSPTHRAFHNIFHGAIQDRAFALARVPLRSLHDLGLILGKHGEEVAWDEIEAMMMKRRYGTELRAYLFMANRCLGLRQLPQVHESNFLKFYWKLCLAQIRPGWLTSAIDLSATLTHPLARATVEYIHGEADGHLTLFAKRAKHCYVLTQKHHFGVFSKLAKVYRRMYRHS